MNTPSEITNFQLAIDAEQQVFGLDVSVDDMLRVQVGQSIGHLVDVPRASLLRERSVLVELFVKLSFTGEL